MDEVSLTIDGREVVAPRGTTVLRAALQHGIYIPHLCDYRDLTPFAGCRMCLVEVERMRGFETSCTLVARDGMVVRTDTPALREHRLGVLEVLLSDHPDRCLNCPRIERCPPFVACQRDDLVTDRCVTCPRNDQCELQRVVDFVGWHDQRFGNPRRSTPPERSNPFIEIYSDYCIFCARCTRVCDEVIGASAIDLAHRGPHTSISVHFEKELTDSPCIYCGACAIVCPTGALMKADSTFGRIAQWTVPSTCTYCGVGCGLFLNLKHGKLINASPDLDDKASSGYLCVRGQFGYDFATSKERLTTPLVRRQGEEYEVAWDEALDEAARRLAEVRRKHGPDAIGVVGSGKTTNEEAYLLQKLARAVLGTNNVDHPSGQLYQAPTVEALRAAFGVPAMTLPIADLETSGCILLVGSNTLETHPVLFFKVQRAVRRGARLILVDPKASAPKRYASVWLRPRPGTDVALVNGMLRVILDEGLEDRAFVEARTAGLDELVASLEGYSLERVSRVTGVAAEDVVAAARLFATGGADPRHPLPPAWHGLLVTPGQRPPTRSSAIVYAGGVVHHVNGADAVQALANLALLTGMVGKPGSGVAPLAGHNNTQGACDMGLLPGYLPGYREVADPTARAALTAAWGAEPPARPGLILTEMLEGIEAGRIRALYVVGANVLRSAPDVDRVERSLKALDLLVVQDIFPTATSKLAHVVLPAASAVEKDGTITNIERRVQRVRAALPPPGESRPDWWIVAELAKRTAALLERCRKEPTLTPDPSPPFPHGEEPIPSEAKEGSGGLGLAPSFDYAGPAEVFAEIASVVPEYGGLSHERLDAAGGLQWPCPTPDHPGTPYLFAESFATPDGRGHFVPVDQAEPKVDPAFPLLLSTGRSMQFNTGAISDRAKRLAAMREPPRLEINPEDARAAGVAHGDRVRVVSARGELVLAAHVTSLVLPGQVFAYLDHDESPANRLTALPVGGRTKMPELKAVPVRVEKA